MPTQTLRLPHHLPELDGLRAIAALGVVVTHVSFQTGTGWGIAERFDYFVAVFFALSAFLLWRRRGLHSPARYFFSRFTRLVPAYLTCVIAVLLFFPATFTVKQVLVNLTSTQIYVAEGLAPGLTHLWSLCVEFAFYLVLPLLTMTIGTLAARTRIIVLIAAAVVSLGWGFLPFVADFEDGDINSQIWPPAYTLWFVVGMLAAEFEPHTARVQGLRWIRPLSWLPAIGCLWLASREFFGPLGLEHPEPGEFARRVLVGGIFAACVVVPVALLPRENSLLTTPLFQALGRWSYSIFLWHVALLGVAFPLTGISLFSGSTWDFCVILLATVALTIPVSAASYILVEKPARTWLNQWLAAYRRPGAHRQANAAATNNSSKSESPA
ncbi:MAG: acyltransferase [Corynebacterium camporealensis]|uniref:acyltransferase family protein n=1 Tax=Corynebacterium camporealensis TaxID=161896 RepID=UPI002A9166EC|nr:acyltransferase [Corynebacterium camporealensis]MDY5840565.1 acyltransferase [Corynebacterium camporealensis]